MVRVSLLPFLPVEVAVMDLIRALAALALLSPLGLAAGPHAGPLTVARLRLGDPKPPDWAWITEVAFSPDGRRVAASCRDRAVRVYDAGDGKLWKHLKEHGGDANGVAFLGGGRLASACNDDVLRIWEAGRARVLRKISLPKGGMGCMAISSDRKRLATGGQDRTIRLWDPATGKNTLSFGGDQGQVIRLAFSPKGDCLASTSSDNTVRLWNASSGMETRRIGSGHGWPLGLAFHPGGGLLATGRTDGLVRLWDIGTGLEVLALKGHAAWISSLAFSPDGRTLASGDYKGEIRLWEVAGGGERARLRGHRGPVWALAFSPDGTQLASGASDGAVLLWDIAGRRSGGAAFPLEASWAGLDSSDAARSYAAMNRLGQTPRAAAFLRKKLRPPAADGPRTARLIAGLEGGDFASRGKALAALIASGPTAIKPVRKTLAGATDPDLRLRLFLALAGLTRGPGPRRQRRALEVLERLGDEGGRAALAALVEDAPEGWLNKAAAAAAKRLKPQR